MICPSFRGKALGFGFLPLPATTHVRLYSRALSPTPLIYESVSTPVPTALSDSRGSAAGSEAKKCELPALFFFNTVRAILGPLRFHRNFMTAFPIPAKKHHWDFDRDYNSGLFLKKMWVPPPFSIALGSPTARARLVGFPQRFSVRPPQALRAQG